MNFKQRKIERYKEKHYVIVKGSVQQEESIILNLYAPNTGPPRYIEQVINDLQRDLIIVGDFNIPLPILDQQDRELTRISST